MKCKICREREAEVRDRNEPLSKRKTVCKKCHGQRLMCDLSMILDLWARREKC